MALTVAQMAVKVGGETQGAEQALSRVNEHVNRAKEGFGGMLKNALGMATGFAVFQAGAMAMGFLSSQIKDVIAQGGSQQAVMADTVNTLKTMGTASGQTADSIGTYADSMARLTGISDDVIQHSENVMLTFSNLGKNIFPQAETAAINLSAKMGGDLQGATVMVGKALNDPIKGITALTRVGVSMTEQEKESIKTMMAHNNIAGAQGIIMGELNKQFGGVAETAGKTFPGMIERAKVVLDQFKEKIGLAVIPILEKLGGFISGNIGPVFQTLGNIWAQLSSELGGVAGDFQFLARDVFGGLAQMGGQVAGAFKGIMGAASPLDAIMHALSVAINGIDIFFIDLMNHFNVGAPLFTGLEKGAAGLVTGFQQFVSILVHDVIPAGIVLFQRFMQIREAIFNAVMPVLARLIPIVLSVAASFAHNVLPAIMNLSQHIMTDLVPVLLHLWNIIAPRLIPILHLVGTVLTNVVFPAIGKVIQIIGGLLAIVGWLIDKLTPVIDFILGFVGKIVQAFQWLFDKIVGHSIIPDLVNAVLSWIQKFFQIPIMIGQMVLQFIGKIASLELQVLAKIASLVTGFLGKIGDLAASIVGAAGNVVSNLLGAFTSLPGKMLDIGGQVMDGLKNGLMNKLNDLKNTAGNIAGNLLGGLKDKLGIHSPSQVMADEVGKPLIEGMAAGILKARQVAQTALQSVGTSLLTPINVMARSSTFVTPVIGAGAGNDSTLLAAINRQNQLLAAVANRPIMLDGRIVSKGLAPYTVDAIRGQGVRIG